MEKQTKFLIADMCYHQVMTESMYMLFEQIGDTYIIANESKMKWLDSIPKEKITHIDLFKKLNCITRRINRFYFILYIFLHRKKFNYIIFTAGIEFTPKLTRFIWYNVFNYLCKSKSTKVIEVVHSIKFWQDGLKKKRSAFLLKSIQKNLFANICLSEFVLDTWLKTGVPTRPSIRVPFLLVSKEHIDKVPTPIGCEQIIIGILGTVCHRRRNYDILQKAVLNLNSEARKRIKFYFQGPPVTIEDQRFLEQFSKLVETKYRLEYASTDEMHTLMSKCHLFFAPLNDNYGYGVYRESGAGFDAIRYQRCTIVPKGIVSKEFEDIMIVYDNIEDLNTILNTLSIEKISMLNQKAKSICLEFTADRWAQKVRSFLIQNG